MFKFIRKWVASRKCKMSDPSIHINKSDHDWQDLSLATKEMFAYLPIDQENYEKLNINETEEN